MGDHPDYERDAHIPNRECRSDHDHKALTFFSADLTYPKRELRACQKKNDTQDAWRKKAKKDSHRVAENKCQDQQDRTKNDKRTSRSRAKLHMTRHTS